jgi:hypothetical protein
MNNETIIETARMKFLSSILGIAAWDPLNNEENCKPST